MERTTDWIQTYTGLKFWPIEPSPEDIDIRDIAHALSLTCRFNGHTIGFYSVAQHSVLVSQHSDPRWGLLHDATEAYLSDITRPVKPYISNYKELEAKLLLCIAEKFGLEWPMPPCVKAADMKLLATERRDLMAGGPLYWGCLDGVEPLDEVIGPLEPLEAEELFLRRYAEVFTER